MNTGQASKEGRDCLARLYVVLGLFGMTGSLSKANSEESWS